MLEELSTVLNISTEVLGPILGHEILKDEDFTLVGRLTLADGTTRIVKACRSPLDAEMTVYRAFGDLDGLAPDCTYSRMVRPDMGVMILEDIPGCPLRQRFEQAGLEDALSGILGVHSRFADVQAEELPSCRHFDLMPNLERFVQVAQSLCDEPLPRGDKIRGCMKSISESVESYPATLVHGDLFHDNIILTSCGVRIIDWSFAHVGIGLLDIASILCNDKRKNFGNRSLDEQAAVYGRTLEKYSHRRPLLTPQQELCVGRVLMCLRFGNWMLTRMLVGKWRYSSPSEAIGLRVNSLLKCCTEAVERL